MPQNTDPRKPDSVVEIRDFGGMSPNSDPHDLPPGGSTSQVNAVSIRPGELQARRGARVVRFD